MATKSKKTPPKTSPKTPSKRPKPVKQKKGDPIKVSASKSLNFISIRKKVLILFSRNFFKKSYQALFDDISQHQKPSAKKNAKAKDDPSFFCIVHEVDWDKSEGSGAGQALRMLVKRWDFEAAISVEKSYLGNFPINNLPAYKKTITIRHKGPYEQIGKSYQQIVRYARENGLSLENRSMEYYVNDPDKVKPEDLLTDIVVPIKARK